MAFASFANNVGLTGGAYVGYDWQANNTVLGIEGDINASTKQSSDVYGSVRGRLGVTNKGYLFYGTAGVAFLHDTAPTGLVAGGGGGGGNGGTALAGPGGAGGAGGIASTVGGNQNLTGFVGGLGQEEHIGAHATAGI